MSAGRVLLLNGPPSCGKTTLVLALQEVLGEPWVRWSLDDCLAGFRRDFLRSDDGSVFERALRGYLGALRSMALAGNDVVAEAVITWPRVPWYAEAFEGLAVTLVGVRCDLQVARRRERERTDRVAGPLELPEDKFAAVHAGMDYDLEVDTSTSSAAEVAGDLAIRLRQVRPTAFGNLTIRRPSGAVHPH